MTVSPVIVGPASPRELSHWLDGSDREKALSMPGLGGSPVNQIVNALLSAGVTVELVTLAEELTQPVTFEGPRLRILAAPFRRRARHRAQDFFRAERRHVQALVAEASGQVVSAHWTYEFALGALASSTRPTSVQAQDVPFTILRHLPDTYRAIRTAMAIATRLRTTRLVANSPYCASAWRRQMFYRGSITIIPNIVPPVASDRTPPKGDGAPTILEVSDGGRRKNVQALVRAMPHVCQAHPAARLRLVGPGLAENSELARLAGELGISQAIDFLGPADPAGVAREYAAATVFVHASREETFGMTVAEAMSFGLPVIGGASAGAVPWVLGHGRAGLLVDVQRPDAIARALCKLLDDEPLRTRLGAAAVERTRSTFSPSVLSAVWMQFFEDMEQTWP